MLLIFTRLGPLLGVKGFMAPRLQAVPFWIVEKSRKIAKREKAGAKERKGAWGEAEKRSLLQSLLVYFSSLQSRCAVSAPSRLTRKGLLAVHMAPTVADLTVPFHSVMYLSGIWHVVGPQRGSFVNGKKRTQTANSKMLR